MFLNERGLARSSWGLPGRSYDKREYLKENDAKREMDKAMKITEDDKGSVSGRRRDAHQL